VRFHCESELSATSLQLQERGELAKQPTKSPVVRQVRILHVVGGLNRGGVETWLLQVFRHIDRRKYQFDFLVHTEQPCAYDDEVRSLGARIIPCLAPLQPVRYARNLLRILRALGPYDCVHSHVHHFSGYVLTVARWAGVPMRISHSHLDTQRDHGRKFYRFVATTMLRTSATAGLAASYPAANSLFGENWETDPRWRVSYCGIDLESFSRPVDSSKARAELGIPEHAYVVGHVGRFSAQKNHVFLLEIAKHVCAMNADAVFVLVGEGPLRNAMELKAEHLGIYRNTIFAGVRDDIAQLMKGVMDVFLFPSLYEGLPLVLIEAQAAGLPCFIADTIASETDIVPELVTRLSLADSAETWARSVARAAPRAERRMHLDAMHEFSIDAAVSRLCHVYDEQ
jgi:glycosyltransferase involved in cell wall biosynthesis